LHKAGIVKEYTDGWAVAFWFIPFLNLLRPYQMMREMFYNTADFLKKNGVATAQLPDPIIARTWWIWFILCTVGISFVDKILELSEMNITFSEEYLIQGISTLFTCIAAFYAVLTVQELFKAEEKIMSIIAEAEPEADYS
jgi:hypothetical protein